MFVYSVETYGNASVWKPVDTSYIASADTRPFKFFFCNVVLSGNPKSVPFDRLNAESCERTWQWIANKLPAVRQMRSVRNTGLTMLAECAA